MAVNQSGHEGYDGLSQLAHAVRRSTAAYIAMNITAPDKTVDDMLDNADKIAAWIGGEALIRSKEQRAEPRAGAIGVPFKDRDAL